MSAEHLDWAALCAQLPGAHVERDAFERFAADRVTTPERTFDLFLAFACGHGDARAIAAFHDRFGAVIEGVRRRFGPRAPTAAELWADLQHHLFVSRDESTPPRILSFGGQSELRSWVKVVTTRHLLNCIDAQKPEDPLDERMLETMGLGGDNPEFRLHRAESQALFREAFAAAVAALVARDRQMLRLAFAEGLTIDDLGALYGMHRTTAFRQLQQASARLSDGLRAHLRDAMKLSDAEYDRWCESLRSGIELSVQRYFASVG